MSSSCSYLFWDSLLLVGSTTLESPGWPIRPSDPPVSASPVHKLQVCVPSFYMDLGLKLRSLCLQTVESSNCFPQFFVVCSICRGEKGRKKENMVRGNRNSQNRQIFLLKRKREKCGVKEDFLVAPGCLIWSRIQLLVSRWYSWATAHWSFVLLMLMYFYNICFGLSVLPSVLPLCKSWYQYVLMLGGPGTRYGAQTDYPRTSAPTSQTLTLQMYITVPGF